MLRLYADSADTDLFADLLSSGVLVGVTTNPTILQAAGRSLADSAALFERWHALGAREVFFQAVGASEDDYLDSARRICAIDPSVSVKIPATGEGFRAAARLARGGASVLVTAVYTPAQAAVASAVGAKYIAPYLGRLDDSGRDGLAVIRSMMAAMRGSDTEVLAASVRTPRALAGLAEAGVRHITAKPAMLRQSFESASTRAAVADFDAATAASAE
ncbi:MAG TPA: transaldolase family protein [Microbacteriaceae bacterium]|nr:transaldolase family protein [Microbacteriaceae bacterium]